MRAALVGRRHADGSGRVASGTVTVRCPRRRSVRVQCAGAPAWPTDSAGSDSAAVPVGVQSARVGATTDADDPPRPTHVHFTRAGWRTDTGRGARRSGALERG